MRDGANGGLGSAFVRAALDRGAARVCAAARKAKDWGGERVVTVELDLADQGSIARAAGKRGDTTILVNNAVIFPHNDLLTVPIEQIEEMFEANLPGPLVLARELAPALRTANGALLNVGPAGEREVFATEMTKKVHAGLAADVTALCPVLAGA
ncbi:SDR family NAD(P)-dependent oxidoreductase [Amycolatopsis sp. NPDC023774]|uniref:SDR family NAD(P)-dependent oxidoreductase n=1 Tax=Amycolatopsis sp. NPDC023774 TaxID=3155015 RepID=UPI003408E24B